MGQFSYECRGCGKHSQFDWITNCVVVLPLTTGEKLWVEGLYDGYGRCAVRVGANREARVYLRQFEEHFERWGPGEDAEDADSWDSAAFRLPELRALCADKGLETTGSKAALRDRLDADREDARAYEPREGVQLIAGDCYCNCFPRTCVPAGPEILAAIPSRNYEHVERLSPADGGITGDVRTLYNPNGEAEAQTAQLPGLLLDAIMGTVSRRRGLQTLKSRR